MNLNMNTSMEERVQAIVERLNELREETADLFSEPESLAEEESDGFETEALKEICDDYASEIDGNFESAIDDVNTLFESQDSSEETEKNYNCTIGKLHIDIKFKKEE